MRYDIATTLGATRVPPVLIASAAALPLLFLSDRWQVAIAVMLVGLFGVSHGASDHLLAGAGWRHRFGSWWLMLFIAVYVVLIVAVFAIWMVAPAIALSGFLCLAAVHFALDDLPEDFHPHLLTEMIGRGLFPVTGAALLYREQVENIFSALLGSPGIAAQFATTMAALSIPAGLALIFALVRRMHHGDRSIALEIAGMLVVLTFFPPALGFAIYFSFVHARRQLDHRCRELGLKSFEYHTRFLPYILGGASVLLLAFVFVTSATTMLIAGLAALTVPHMLLPDPTPTARRMNEPRSRYF